MKLKVMLRDRHVANLSMRGNEFILVYEDKFIMSYLHPFHGMGMPIIGLEYTSETLWYPFASRMSNLDRSDVKRALTKVGLTKDSNPLEILLAVGTHSICNNWHLEKE